MSHSLSPVGESPTLVVSDWLQLTYEAEGLVASTLSSKMVAPMPTAAALKGMSLAPQSFCGTPAGKARRTVLFYLNSLTAQTPNSHLISKKVGLDPVGDSQPSVQQHAFLPR